MKEKGQIVVLLLLVMVVALAIGLSIISRSVLEVSTSRKSEDSSRAFSAAEAGIERALQANINNLGGDPISVDTFNLGNQSKFNSITPVGLPTPDNKVLAYPPFGKDAFAQFWLANPDNVNARGYNFSSFNIYFGDPTPNNDPNYYTLHPEEQPAIEVNIIYWNATENKYLPLREYYDSYKNTPSRNNFSTCDLPQPTGPIFTNNNINQTSYYCKVIVTGYLNTSTSFPIIVRVRLLYTNLSHPVALEPTGGGVLPKQADIYNSSGSSGDVTRTLEVTRYKQSMPQIFDYVLFSAKDLSKN